MIIENGNEIKYKLFLFFFMKNFKNFLRKLIILINRMMCWYIYLKIFLNVLLGIVFSFFIVCVFGLWLKKFKVNKLCCFVFNNCLSIWLIINFVLWGLMWKLECI